MRTLEACKMAHIAAICARSLFGSKLLSYLIYSWNSHAHCTDISLGTKDAPTIIYHHNDRFSYSKFVRNFIDATQARTHTLSKKYAWNLLSIHIQCMLINNNVDSNDSRIVWVSLVHSCIRMKLNEEKERQRKIEYTHRKRCRRSRYSTQ